MAYLEFRDIRKSFSGVEVLRGVDLSLERAEIHALIGENGAGKSTLMKILAGYQPPSSGQVLLEGQPLHLRSSLDAERAGIVLLHQEFNLAEDLTVAENFYLGHELRRGPWLDTAAMERGTAQALERVGLRLDPRTRTRDLIVPQRQMLEIAKALSRDARVLILDEPTAPLTPQETHTLFDLMRALRTQGVTLLFVSHKLDEVQEISDRVTVLRDGQHISTAPTATLTQREMAHRMVGREMQELYPPKREARPAPSSGQPAAQPTGQVTAALFSAEQVSVPGWVHGVGFTLERGEILGLYGLVGSGRTELFEGIFGLRQRTGGSFRLEGRPLNLHSPRQAAQAGMVYLSEDRKGKGLHLDFALRPNLTLMALERYAHPLLDLGAEQRALEHAVSEFSIRAGSLEVRAGSLSGGNQQKLALAKLMQLEPQLIVLDEPTRGVDVGAKHEIYLLMRRLTTAGKAVVMVSSELPELLGMADRVLVMRQGRVVGALEGEAVNERAVIALATGVSA